MATLYECPTRLGKSSRLLERGVAMRGSHLHKDTDVNTGAVLTLAHRNSWFCNDIRSPHSSAYLNERLDCSRAAGRPRAAEPRCTSPPATPAGGGLACEGRAPAAGTSAERDDRALTTTATPPYLPYFYTRREPAGPDTPLPRGS